MKTELLSNHTQDLDPLSDPRWCHFVRSFKAASVFHSQGWLQALHQTYGYKPVAFTATTADGDLRGGLLFCRVESKLTGRRLVSLPFSDNCEPLISSLDDLRGLLEALKVVVGVEGYRYFEIRPFFVTVPDDCGLERSHRFWNHRLDLRPTTEELFSGFHKDCVQRKIHRAEREGLAYEEGRSTQLLRKFYSLQIITRRRQQLPPQPFAWFQNLAQCMGEKLKVRVASKNGMPVASIITIQHRNTLIYKYGCSDRALSNLGGTQFLFWKAIQDAKSQGLQELDLGRSDWDNEGLIQFKDRLGATRSTLTYWRYPASSVAQTKDTWPMNVAKRVFSHLPSACLSAAGNLLYRHVG